MLNKFVYVLSYFKTKTTHGRTHRNMQATSSNEHSFMFHVRLHLVRFFFSFFFTIFEHEGKESNLIVSCYWLSCN